MSRKVYRSSQGNKVDLGALQIKNETVRAVGNMNVNARGDVLDSQNNVVDKRTQRMTRQYRRQANVMDDSIPVSRKEAKQQPEQVVAPEQVVDNGIQALQSELPVEESAPIAVSEPEPAPAEDPTPVGGLADAIAKARAVKQEPMKTPRQQAQEKSGVRKI